MPKVTEQYREARRAQILAAARRCFLQRGFHETSMQDLLAEAGLSSGAVYRYFPSKEEMIVAIAEENLGEVVSVLRRPGARSPGAAVAGVLDFIRSRHAADGFAAIAVLVWSEALRNPALAARLTAVLGEMDAAFGGLGDERLLPEGMSAESLPGLLGSIVAGFILQLAIIGPDAAADLPATVRAMWPPPSAG